MGFAGSSSDLPFVRASATSRISSPAVLASAQKTDTNKADEASPFALLVGSAEAKPAIRQPQHKDPQAKDNSGDKRNDKPGTVGANGQTNTGAAQTAAQAPVKPVKADKSDDKSSKNKDDSSDTPDGSAATAALQQVNTQSQPAAATQLAAMAANTAAAASTDTTSDGDAGDDQPGVTAAGATAAGQATAQAGQAAQNLQVAQDGQPVQNSHGAGQGNANTDQANQADSSQPAAAKNAGQNQPVNAQAQAQLQAQAQSHTQAQSNPAGQNPAQQGAVQPDGVQQSAKPWQAKLQNSGDKTDASQAAAKADDVKQAVTPAPQALTANNSLASKQDLPLGNAMPLIGGAQAQATSQGSDGPAVAQNVQVSTTPTPNMPALAVEIAAKSQSGAKQFDIRLDPPELGRVEVRLSIDATGKASAHLSADQPQTLDLLQKDAPALTRALRDAGLDVSQNGLNFSLRQQSSDSGAGQGQSFGNGRSFKLSATSSIDTSSASAAYSAPADGRLDIRV